MYIVGLTPMITMAKKGFQNLLPPTESPGINPEIWLDFFAKCEARFLRWTDPVTKDVQIVIRRCNKELGGGGRHLFGKFTREKIVHAFLRNYRTIDAINSEIKNRE